MVKFAAQFVACAVFAAVCGGAIAGETRNFTYEGDKGKDNNDCATSSACQHEVTYVSGKGKDNGGCHSPANPCRTFQYAVDRTKAGGEVKTLDPANYFPVKIRKSIAITGVDGAGIDAVGGPAVDAITEVGAAKVYIDNLVIQNLSGSGGAGTSAIFGNYISISRCTVRGFNVGISIGLNGNFLISNTVVTNNATGILLGDGNGTLDHVTASNNGIGINFETGTLNVIDTLASGNGTGIRAAFGNLYIAHSTAVGNGTGLAIIRSSAISFGDNHIKGNGKDIVSDPANAVLTNVGTQ